MGRARDPNDEAPPVVYKVPSESCTSFLESGASAHYYECVANRLKSSERAADT